MIFIYNNWDDSPLFSGSQERASGTKETGRDKGIYAKRKWGNHIVICKWSGAIREDGAHNNGINKISIDARMETYPAARQVGPWRAR